MKKKILHKTGVPSQSNVRFWGLGALATYPDQRMRYSTVPGHVAAAGCAAPPGGDDRAERRAARQGVARQGRRVCRRGRRLQRQRHRQLRQTTPGTRGCENVCCMQVISPSNSRCNKNCSLVVLIDWSIHFIGIFVHHLPWQFGQNNFKNEDINKLELERMKS